MSSTRWLAAIVFAAVCALASALAGVAASAPMRTATPVPDRVYAPYFETWTADSIATVAHQSGARYFTLAFLETLGRTPARWLGTATQRRALRRADTSMTSRICAPWVATSPVLRWMVGRSAGTEIGDSCGSVDRIARAYEKVIRTYDVSRLDMDIEGDRSTEAPASTAETRRSCWSSDWATAHVVR